MVAHVCDTRILEVKPGSSEFMENVCYIESLKLTWAV